MFKTSHEYWENRYKQGGNSGPGSYRNLGKYKGEIINNFIGNNEIKSIIDLGCGDGNQLKYLKLKSYLGFDVSKKSIEKCSEIFKEDKTKSFKLISLYDNEKADLTMSLDVIYHLIEEDVFVNYMNILFNASNKYVIVYSSNTDDNKFVSPHIKHRKFTDWVEENRDDFILYNIILNKYPFNDDIIKSSFSDFYIYRKK